MPNLSTRLLIGLTGVLLAGCSGESANPGHSFTVHDEDGIYVTETSGGPRYGEELFQYEKVLELREDEREESLLFRPIAFWMDSTGRFYVEDQGNHRIAVFDEQGRFLFSMGREGSGPGEFRRTFQITGIRSDTLVVLEKAQNRITRFRTSGTLIDVITVYPPSAMLMRLYELGGDRFLGLGSDFTNSPPYISRAYIIVHNAMGDTLDIRHTSWIETGYQIPDTRSVARYPLGARSIAWYRPDWGWVLTTGEEPILAIHDAGGNVRKIIRIDMPRTPVSQSDYRIQSDHYERQIALADERGREVGLTESRIEEWKVSLRVSKDNIQLSEYWAFWQSIEVDDDHYIWLEKPEHPLHQDLAGGGILYRVLSPEGEYLGDSRRPPAAMTRVCHGYLLAVERVTETGGMRLAVFRIHPQAAGLEYPQ